MDILRILHGSTTADLYDLLADTLNALVERGEEVTFGSDGIETRFADIAEKDGDIWAVTFYEPGCAELASQERGHSPLEPS